jgi:hypothetical protein
MSSFLPVMWVSCNIGSKGRADKAGWDNGAICKVEERRSEDDMEKIAHPGTIKLVHQIQRHAQAELIKADLLRSGGISRGDTQG